MKKNLLILFCIFISVKIYAQDTIKLIAYLHPMELSNFEDRDKAHFFSIDKTKPNNLWIVGKPSKTIFNSAYSAPLAIMTDTLSNYPNTNSSSFEFVMNTDDQTHITFWHRFNTDSLADGGVVEVSMNGGSTWANILDVPQFKLTAFYNNATKISSNSNKAGFTGNSNWIKSTIVSNLSLHFVRFRFTFTSDNTNTNKEGWEIDSFNFNCLGTGITEKKSASPFRISPNPTSNLISIRSEENLSIKTIEVKDVLGKTILRTSNSTVDLSPFEVGMYFLQILTDKGIVVERVQRIR